MKYLSLKIFKNSQFLKTKIFTDDQISIGSSEGLSLSLPEISSWHLLIERRQNVFCVMDLNSEMGTMLNGVRIKEESLLESGAVIKAGPYELQFFVGPPVSTSQKPSSPAPVPPQAPAVPAQPAPTPAQPTPQTPAMQSGLSVGQKPPQTPAMQSASQKSPQTSVGQASLSADQKLPQTPARQEGLSAGQKAPQTPAEQTVIQEAPKAPSQKPVSQESSQVTTQKVGSVSVPQTPAGQSGLSAGQKAPQTPTEQGISQEAPQAPAQKSALEEPTVEETTTVEEPSQTLTQELPVPEVPAQEPTLQESLSQEPLPQPAFTESLDQGEDLNVIPVKKKKGFWNTYAPSSRIKNLDDEISPSIGHLIEVTLAWKDRILKTYHFSKSQNVHIGSDKKCEIYFPNMLNSSSYKLMSISGGAKIYVNGPVKGTLFQGKNKETRVTHDLKNDQTIVLKPYEVVKLNFNSFLTVYIRLTSKPAQPPLVGLLNLRLSEALALLFAFLLTGLLFFYGTLYAPAFLMQDVDFIEKDARVAQVVFEKLPPKKKKAVKYDLNKKEPTTKKTTKAPKLKKEVKKVVKKPAIKTPIKKKVKKVSTPKKGKQGKIAAVAPGKAKKKTKKVKVGSARPGGSLKTGKKGSSAKTKAPDPTKMSVLGVFGGGGSLNKLDQAASGPGGLTGLATEYTGYGGTAEEYEGQGIGTKTKELSSGGQGSAIVGISGIKTKGKGLGTAGTGTGGLGERGRLSMEFSTEDIDVSGEIDRDGILRVLRSNRSKFDRCYQMALNSNASIQGKLPMQWRIASSGRGQRASALKSSIKSAGLKSCVADVLESLNFPAPPSGQIPEVKFSFNFTL